MINSTIVHLGCGEVEVEYNYTHFENPKNNSIELITVCALKDPEKHLTASTLNVIKNQIHFFERGEREAVLISVINQLK
jgi:hypothetical protein